MPKDKKDVIAIKEWLAKEPYLPSDLDDFVLEKFLHSCYGSLEKTKKCIEKFCTTRSIMNELYTARDPMLEHLQTAFSITNVTTYWAGNREILIYQYGDPTLEKFQFYDMLKTFCVQADIWIKDEKCLAEKHIIIMDFKNFSLRMVPKINIFFLREFLVYLLEGMPVRVKEVYAINAPTFVDKFLALVKPALPADIYNLIRVLPDSKSLHKYIDKKYLPKEYDGDAESTAIQQVSWQKKIKNQRSIFQNDLWKADLQKKPRNNFIDDSMNGSFKTLCID